jgi:adenosylcobyric acid synthase
LGVITILGTGAYSSKTLLSAALLRSLSNRGAKAAPFKALVVLRGRDEEPSRNVGSYLPHHLAAARLAPHPDYCPAAVMQTGPTSGRLELQGHLPVDVDLPCRDTVPLSQLRDGMRQALVSSVNDAIDRVVGEHTHVVVEGAGSPVVLDPAEDLPNVAVARRLGAPVVLTGQFSHGTAAAALIGTYQCLPDDIRDLVGGFVIANTPASPLVERSLRQVEASCGIPALGVLPANDSLTYEELYSDEALQLWAGALRRDTDLEGLLKLSEATR